MEQANPGNRVGAGLGRVHTTNGVGEDLELLIVDVENPLEVRVHLVLHLIDLLEGIEVLSDDTPRLVQVRVVAYDLRGDHESGDKKAVARRATGGREALFEPGEEEKRSKDDGLW